MVMQTDLMLIRILQYTELEVFGLVKMGNIAVEIDEVQKENRQ